MKGPFSFLNLLCLILITLSIVAVLVYSQGHVFSRPSEKFDNIVIGMSEDDVVGVLGERPFEERRCPFPGTYDPLEFERARVVTTKIWYADGFAGQVGFDHQARVVWKGAGISVVQRRSERPWFYQISNFFGLR
jgi:hypothetical protein